MHGEELKNELRRSADPGVIEILLDVLDVTCPNAMAHSKGKR